MMNRKVKSGNVIEALELVLFSDRIAMRWLRISCLLILVFGWGVLGSLLLESERDGLTVSNILRYALVPFASGVGALLLGARYLQHIYELQSYLAAVRYLIASMFDGPPYSNILFSGKLLPKLNVPTAVGDKTHEQSNLLQRIGGPGWLSVERGNAVLIEYLESPARVLGPGLHYIPRFQHVEETYSLEDQHWEAKPVIATTKDGIEVIVHDFQFGYRLAPSSHGNGTKKRTAMHPYPLSASSIWKLAYNRNVMADGKPMEWGRAAQAILESKIIEYINRNSIDEIIAPVSSDPRNSILDRLKSASIHAAVRDALGTEITWQHIGRFEIKNEAIRNNIRERRLSAWFAEWSGKAALLRAEGKAEQISQTESGRIEKTTSMLRGILQALEDVDIKGDVEEHVWNIVLARTAQIIESMTSYYGIEPPHYSADPKA